MTNVKVYYGYIDEPTLDGNKHPEEQINDLISLIKSSEGEVSIFTNSPYILNEIVLIESYSSSKIPNEERGNYADLNITNQHFEITKNGEVIEGEYYHTMISDNNMLNMYLSKCNDKFADFLDLCQRADNDNFKF